MACLPSSSEGSCATDVDVDAIRAGLHRAVGGKWTHKFACARASQCGCPFELELRHDGSGCVSIWQTEAHQFHDPTSAADLSQLKLDPDLEAHACTLLRAGLKPAQVCGVLEEMVRNGTHNGTGGAALTHANARICPSPAQVAALRKRMLRESGFGLTSDPVALAALVAELKAAGCIAHYQPYKAPAKEGGQGQDLVVVIQTPFQARMLNQFGSRLTFMDSTGTTNQYGYPLYALVVRFAAGIRHEQQKVCAILITKGRHAHPLSCPHLLLCRSKMRVAVACLSGS